VIDFRYHLVSIVAVFLALAVGLVIGATALKPKTEQFFDSRSKQEEQKISAQKAQISSLQNQLGSDQAAAKANAPRLLDNLLTGQRAVLVTAPGADASTITGVTAALRQAGAVVTGQAELQSSFFDTSTSTESSLTTLAQQVAPPSVALGVQSGQPTANAKIFGQQEAAQVLAPALVTKIGADLPAQQTRKIIDGFAAQGFMNMTYEKGSTALSQATLAVVVIPATQPSGGGADPANLALLAVAQQLQESSLGVVMAGSLPGSGTGSAIDQLINGGTSIQLSSVDDANYEVGQIEVAQALSLVLTGHKPAAFGVLSNTVPSPAPTPAPTATPTPTRSSAKNKSGG
jgi:Copper transport outer membrane protein, MctB